MGSSWDGFKSYRVKASRTMTVPQSSHTHVIQSPPWNVCVAVYKRDFKVYTKCMQNKNCNKNMRCLLRIVLITQMLGLGLLNASPPSAFSVGSGGARQQGQLRTKRRGAYNDYFVQVYINIASGHWKRENCDLLYNCHNVSSRHCTKDASWFFNAEQERKCD